MEASMGHTLLLPPARPSTAPFQSIYTTIWPQVHAKLKGILSTPIQATICNDQTKKYCLTKLHFPLSFPSFSPLPVLES